MDKRLIDAMETNAWRAVATGLCLRFPTSPEDARLQIVERIKKAKDRAEAQEPVAVVDFREQGWREFVDSIRVLPDGTPLYATPQPPAPCPTCKGRANGSLVAMPVAGLKALQAKVAVQSVATERSKTAQTISSIWGLYDAERAANKRLQAKVSELEADADLYGKKDQANYGLRQALITAIATLERDGDEWGICDQLKAALTPSADNSLELERDEVLAAQKGGAA